MRGGTAGEEPRPARLRCGRPVSTAPPPTHPPTHPPTPTPSYLTAHCFNRAQVGLTPIEGDLTANFMVVGLVAGLNVGAYLGFLWLLAPHAAEIGL